MSQLFQWTWKQASLTGSNKLDTVGEQGELQHLQYPDMFRANNPGIRPQPVSQQVMPRPTVVVMRIPNSSRSDMSTTTTKTLGPIRMHETLETS